MCFNFDFCKASMKLYWISFFLLFFYTGPGSFWAYCVQQVTLARQQASAMGINISTDLNSRGRLEGLTVVLGSLGWIYVHWLVDGLAYVEFSYVSDLTVLQSWQCIHPLFRTWHGYRVRESHQIPLLWDLSRMTEVTLWCLHQEILPVLMHLTKPPPPRRLLRWAAITAFRIITCN